MLRPARSSPAPPGRARSASPSVLSGYESRRSSASQTGSAGMPAQRRDVGQVPDRIGDELLVAERAQTRRRDGRRARARSPPPPRPSAARPAPRDRRPSASHRPVVEPYQNTQKSGHQFTWRSELATARPSRVEQHEARHLGRPRRAGAAAGCWRCACRGGAGHRRSGAARSNVDRRAAASASVGASDGGGASGTPQRVKIDSPSVGIGSSLCSTRPAPVVDVRVAAAAAEPDPSPKVGEPGGQPVQERRPLPPWQALVVVGDVAEAGVEGEALVQQARARARRPDQEHGRARRPCHRRPPSQLISRWRRRVVASPAPGGKNHGLSMVDMGG